jgi:hypothetical protein
MLESSLFGETVFSVLTSPNMDMLCIGPCAFFLELGGVALASDFGGSLAPQFPQIGALS